MQLKRNKWIASLTIVLLFVSGILLTGCDKDETDNSIVLNSFGPSPALRGGELRFIGKNLGEVSSIVFPGLTGGTVEVSDITVVNEREIKINIPQDAGTGILLLKTTQGDISTLTPITYSEPIEIESVSPLKVKAGETLTIKGDYLNLIKEVIFVDNVVVSSEDFLTGQTRKQLQVVVPAEAQTGKIRISNGAEIPIELYYDDEIEVVLPTFTSFSPETIKPGKTITLTGKDLDLVESIVFGGNKTVTEFTLNETATTITATVPTDVQDGTVKLIAKSTVEIESAKSLTTVLPSSVAVSPKTVKNGEALTITDKDLDLVSEVRFGDLVAEIVSSTETKIVVTVPETANSTIATLNTLSTKTVETPLFAYTIPSITSLAPISLMAGSDVTVKGENLDLIRQVVFVSSANPVAVEPTSETSFVVTVPTDATTGKIVFVTVNGTEIESSESLEVSAADIPVISKIPSSVKPGQLLVIEGTKLNLVETVLFEENVKATQFGTRSASLLEVYVPDAAKKGGVTLKLLTFNGKEVSATLTISGTDPIVDASYVFFDFDGKDSWWGSFGSVQNDPELSLNGAYFRVNQELPAGWADFFWRNGQNGMKVDGVTVNEWAVKIDVNVLGSTTKGFKFRLNGSDGDFWAITSGFENRGGWYTVTIPLTEFRDGNGTGSNRLPNVQNITNDFGMATSGDAGFYNICIDNIRFEKVM